MSSGRIEENSFFFEMNEGGKTGMSFFLGYIEEHDQIIVRMSSYNIDYKDHESKGIGSARNNIQFIISPERAAILFNKSFWTENIPKVLDNIKAQVDAKRK